MRVTPTVEDTTSTVTVNGAPVVSGTASAPIDLKLGTNIITVAVTAEDGVTKSMYTVTVIRGYPDTTAPIVTVNKPGRGATVVGPKGGATLASGSASDNVGVAQVLVSLN